MIKGEDLNTLFTSFANFVEKLTKNKVEFVPIQPGEMLGISLLRMSELFTNAAKALDNSEVKVVGQLEPGKIYCLQVKLGSVDVDRIFEVCEGLRNKGIEVIVLDSSASFVSVPEGYEIIKKG
jgi:maleate cis-trans isomerase